MRQKSQIAAVCVAVLVCAGVVFWLTGTSTSPIADPKVEAPDLTAISHDEPTGKLAKKGPSASARQEITADTAPARSDDSKTGALRIRVVYGDDDSPATSIWVFVQEARQADGRPPRRTARTDEFGQVTVEGLHAGTVSAWTDRYFGKFDRATIVAGETIDLLIQVKDGIDISGIVVDSTNAPVPGATIILAGWAAMSPRVITESDEQGRFSLRQIGHMANLSARAKGYATSPFFSISAGAGARVEARLVLEDAGGSVRGTVLGPNGEGVAGVLVKLGKRQRTLVIRMPDGSKGLPPPRGEVLTDAEGSFFAFGLPVGKQPVTMTPNDFAPWLGEVDVVAHTTTPMIIRLGPGATCVGTVRGENDEPIGGVDIRHGDYNDFDHKRTQTHVDGSYRLSGLPPGDLSLVIRSRTHGNAIEELRAVAGETVRCDVTLTTGLVLRGIVLTESGEPVERVLVGGTSIEWGAHAWTDKEGRFEMLGCPKGPIINLRLQKSGYEILHKMKVDAAARARPIALRMRFLGKPTARISGLVVDPDGKPFPAAEVSYSTPGQGGSLVKTTSADGKIEIGKLTPGTYSVRVRGGAFPAYRAVGLQLESGRTTDLGTIQLVHGGHVVVEFADGVPSKDKPVYLRIYQPDGTWAGGGLDIRTSPRSDPLAPGRYALRVSGPAVVSHEIPITVRQGEDTEVSVKVRWGKPVLIRFQLPPDSDLVRRLEYSVAGPGGFMVSNKKSRWRPYEFKEKLGLLPGSYTLRASTDGGHATETKFGVRQDYDDVQEVTVNLQ